MYCIKCGVELSDGKKPCPLCGTVPYHPDVEGAASEPTYPPYVKPEKKIKKSLIMILLTVIYGLTAAELALCDFIISARLGWSVYAIGGMVLFYVAAILPLWFKKPNPIIFTPCFFGAVELYLVLVNLVSGGGWFWSFGFPIAGIAGVIVSAVVVLVKCLKKGYFYIFGGAIIAIGAFVVSVELFANFAFDLGEFHLWSIYPASGALLLGLWIIVLGICEPLRNWFAKKFFI